MSLLSKIVRKPFDYLEYRIQHAKMEVKEQITETLSKLIIFLAIGILALFVVLFLSFGLANLINVWLHTAFWGYFIVMGIYIVLAVILFLMKDKNFLLDKTRHYASVIVKGQHIDKF